MSKYNEQVNLRGNASVSGVSLHLRMRACIHSLIHAGSLRSACVPWEDAFPHAGGLAGSAARLGRSPHGCPFESKELPSASWLSKITWPPASSLLAWQSQNPLPFHPCVRPAGRGLSTKLWVGCWRSMPRVSYACWISRAHSFLRQESLGLVPNVSMRGIFYIKYETRLIDLCGNQLFHIFQLNFIYYL